MGDHPPPRLNRTQSLPFESNDRISAPPNPLSPAAAEEAACIAQDLLTDEWIGVGAHHDRSGVAAGRPADHIARRGVPVHPRRAVGPLREGGVLLPILRPGIDGRGEERSKAQNRSKQSNRERCRIKSRKRHGFLHRFPSHAAANMASVADTGQPTFITSACRRLQLIFAASRHDSSRLLDALDMSRTRFGAADAASLPGDGAANLRSMRLASAVPHPSGRSRASITPPFDTPTTPPPPP